MSDWVEGKVVGMTRWHDTLLSVRVEAPIEPFKAGQFTKLGLVVEGKHVGRAYSFVNPPASPLHEFHFVVVPDGEFSRRLAALEANDPLWLRPQALGHFTMDEVPDADSLWCLATGTGIAPFLSMLRTDEPWRRFATVVLVYGVRYAADLAYGEEIAALRRRWGERFRFVPMLSRETLDGALGGRIPAAIGSGALEERAGTGLVVPKAQVMICGNPDMLKDALRVLEARGFRRNRPRSPGHITTEQYW